MYTKQILPQNRFLQKLLLSILGLLLASGTVWLVTYIRHSQNTLVENSKKQVKPKNVQSLSTKQKPFETSFCLPSTSEKESELCIVFNKTHSDLKTTEVPAIKSTLGELQGRFQPWYRLAHYANAIVKLVDSSEKKATEPYGISLYVRSSISKEEIIYATGLNSSLLRRIADAPFVDANLMAMAPAWVIKGGPISIPKSILQQPNKDHPFAVVFWRKANKKKLDTKDTICIIFKKTDEELDAKIKRMQRQTDAVQRLIVEHAAEALDIVEHAKNLDNSLHISFYIREAKNSFWGSAVTINSVEQLRRIVNESSLKTLNLAKKRVWNVSLIPNAFK